MPAREDEYNQHTTPENTKLTAIDKIAKRIEDSVRFEKIGSPKLMAFCDMADFMHLSELRSSEEDSAARLEKGIELALVENDIRNRKFTLPGYISTYSFFFGTTNELHDEYLKDSNRDVKGMTASKLQDIKENILDKKSKDL